jgi:hypothetical protein
MKVATIVLLVAASLALAGCPEKGSGDAKPAGTSAAAASGAPAAAASGKPADKGGW